VGFTSSADGGASWRGAVQLAGPLSLTWLANTNQGFMVGDYISTSFASGTARPVFASAGPPSGALAEAMFTSATSAPSAEAKRAKRVVRSPVLSASSDHAAPSGTVRRR